MKTIEITKIIINRVERIEIEPATDYGEEVGFSERYITITDETGHIYEIALEGFAKENLEIAGNPDGDWTKPKVLKGSPSLADALASFRGFDGF